VQDGLNKAIEAKEQEEWIFIAGVGGASINVPISKIDMICIFDKELDTSDVEKAIADGIAELQYKK